MNNLIEQKIIEQAKRRIGFRIHFAVYLGVIILNWVSWAITFHNYDNNKWILIWPVYGTLGWGFGILIHYLTVFHTDKLFSVDKEVERLKKRS
ncbi:MAG TPA: 2TM domain-containing protein [Hanamia sp.]|nr:2TM domain-containing protein [Hanamia sp.]